MAAHGSQSIGEGGLGFGIPGGAAGGQVVGMQGVGAEHSEAEEAGEAGGGAGDGRGGPLPLGLEPEVRAQFLEGDFHIPAQQVESHDLFSTEAQVAGEEGEGTPTLLGVTHQHESAGAGERRRSDATAPCPWSAPPLPPRPHTRERGVAATRWPHRSRGQLG